MDIKYDRIADAMYLTFRRGKVAKTLELIDVLNVDVDAAGKLIGIEILDASSQQRLVDSLQRNVNTGVPIEIVAGTSAVA
ncbi:MAG: hypothetical protein B7X04_03635 [Parcubacteria group bacterium 21-54-25]|nr:MAG: hypothetical protein B7X04_03635 [Parcubacteria group bacterium 21-54-25]HQU08077.1 DUF2283 domain-containing protein [Candidatus Paceibacterota bacterium]